MATLSVFTNFRINDEERFLRMKDSFESFKEINAEKWIVNVRGKYKQQTIAFLQENLGNKLVSSVLESNKGWFHDTRLLLKELNTDYLYYWVEDHLNMVPEQKYDLILNELKESRSEFLFTSWWLFDQMEGVYKNIEKESFENIETFVFDKVLARKVKKSHPDHFIIAAQGIFSVDLFKKIVSKNHPFPRRWPKETPFDLEKRVTDTAFLPIRTAIPRYELFASVDDDMGGYPGSLQSRGLYPKRVTRGEYAIESPARTDQPKPPGKIRKLVAEVFPSHVKVAFKKAYIRFIEAKRYLKRFRHHF